MIYSRPGVSSIDVAVRFIDTAYLWSLWLLQWKGWCECFVELSTISQKSLQSTLLDGFKSDTTIIYGAQKWFDFLLFDIWLNQMIFIVSSNWCMLLLYLLEHNQIKKINVIIFRFNPNYKRPISIWRNNYSGWFVAVAWNSIAIVALYQAIFIAIHTFQRYKIGGKMVSMHGFFGAITGWAW